jgi:hypothetical protein
MAGWAAVIPRDAFKRFRIKYGDGKVEALPDSGAARARDDLWVVKVGDEIVVGSDVRACVKAYFEWLSGFKADFARFLEERGEGELAAEKYAEAEELALKARAVEVADVDVLG